MVKNNKSDLSVDVVKREKKPREVTPEVGRPTDYRDEYAEQARKLCLLGATDMELANFFGVVEKTIYNWKDRVPEFLQAIKDGKETADMEVAHSLNKRAMGYEYIEQQAIKVKTVLYNDNGKRMSEVERVEIVPTTKVAPPDTTAGIFWLKNRKSKQWRDKHEISGEDGAPITQLVVIRPQIESSQTEQINDTVAPNGENK